MPRYAPWSLCRACNPKACDWQNHHHPAARITRQRYTDRRLDPYRLAAIRLQNKSTTRLELDPRQLQGRFYAVSFQHRWLGPAGSAEDTTVLYLITRKQRPEQAILPEPAPEKKK